MLPDIEKLLINLLISHLLVKLFQIVKLEKIMNISGLILVLNVWLAILGHGIATINYPNMISVLKIL